MRTSPCHAAQVLLVSIGLAAAGPCQTMEVVIPGTPSSGAVVTTASRHYSDKRGFPCRLDAVEPQDLQPLSRRSMFVGFVQWCPVQLCRCCYKLARGR